MLLEAQDVSLGQNGGNGKGRSGRGLSYLAKIQFNGTINVVGTVQSSDSKQCRNCIRKERDSADVECDATEREERVFALLKDLKLPGRTARQRRASHRWALRGSRTLRERGDDDRPRPLPEAGGGAPPGGLR